MPTPEQNLWHRLKNSLPTGTHSTRIENRAGTGVPDAHIVCEGKAFWVELKITKHHAIDMRPSQIAWNYGYAQAGGVSFILVSRPLKGDAFLFGGGDVLRLACGLCLRPSSLKIREPRSVRLAACSFFRVSCLMSKENPRRVYTRRG